MTDRNDCRQAGRNRAFERFNFWTAVTLLVLAGLHRVLSNTRLFVINGYGQSPWLWILAVQTLCLIGAGLWWRPALQSLLSIRSLLPPATIVTVAWLVNFPRFDSAFVWTIELVVCLVFLLGFVGIPLGLAGIIRKVSRRIRSKGPGGSVVWIRYWVAATLFFATAEVAARFITSANRQTLAVSLPVSYPSANDDRLRIVGVGGSTMVGFPYQPQISLPNMVATLDPEAADVPVHVTNLAEPGVNLRQALEELHLLSSRPDLLLLYAGHNEYFHDPPDPRGARRAPRLLCDPLLGWSDSYLMFTRLIPQRRPRPQSFDPDVSILRDSTFTPEIIKRRVQRFEADLSALAQHCRQNSIATVWFLPATNEGVFRPNRSMCSRPLSPAEEQDLNRRFRAARQLIEKLQFVDALLSLRSLDDSYPDVAEVEYWQGVCHRELGDPASASDAFRESHDHDLKPAHTTTAYRAAIQRVADGFGIEVIDAETVLRNVSPTGLLDRHVIHDNVHPTLAGYWALGQAARHSVTVQLLFDTAPNRRLVSNQADDPSFATMLRTWRFGAAELALAYRRTAFCLETLDKMRWLDDHPLQEAGQYSIWARRLANGEIHPGEEGTESLDSNALPGVRFPD